MLKGFGFSDTVFRVFVLMASRRRQSDCLLAGDGWSDRVYTKEMGYVQNETRNMVLLRHFPELAPAVRGRTLRLGRGISGEEWGVYVA